MSSVKLYKLLQTHVGEVNLVTIRLGREELTKEDAKKIVIFRLETLLAALKA